MLRPGRNGRRGGAGFGASCREGQDPHDVQLWPVAALLLPPPLTPSTLYLPPHFTLTHLGHSGTEACLDEAGVALPVRLPEGPHKAASLCRMIDLGPGAGDSGDSGGGPCTYKCEWYERGHRDRCLRLLHARI